MIAFARALGSSRGIDAPDRALRVVVTAGVGALIVSALAHNLWGVDLDGVLRWMPDCVFRSVSGLPCPGCGMTRALLLLAQLRVGEAVAMHPAAPLAFAATGWLVLGGPVPPRRLVRVAAAFSLCGLLALWAVRLAGV